MTRLYDRLIAYGTAPGVYDPPTPAECLEIAALLKATPANQGKKNDI